VSGFFVWIIILEEEELRKNRVKRMHENNNWESSIVVGSLNEYMPIFCVCWILVYIIYALDRQNNQPMPY